MINNYARDVKRTAAYKKLDKKSVDEIGDDLYPHLTFIVDCVSQFLEVIKIVSSFYRKNIYDMDTVYRGMSDSRYELSPSLARYECAEYNCEHSEVEHYIVNEFLSLRPEAFVGMTSNFDLLSKMQHYGLPTRLLDFTTNPLMALFFACESKPQKDGRVVCHQGELNIATSDIVEAICSSYKKIIDYNDKLDDFLSQNNISIYRYLSRLYRVKDLYTLLSRPKYWNERQQRQSSVFMIFPNELHDTLGLWASWSDGDIGVDRLTDELARKLEVIREHENPLKIYPKREKDEFEKKLERKLNLEKICYDFTISHNTMRRIFDCYDRDEIITQDYNFTEKGTLSFSHRFGFTSSIQMLSKDVLRTQFCSILIKGSRKKLILKELATLGIDKTFVYPELEYTVERIKSKYMPAIHSTGGKKPTI